ncbi:hypothetical protein IAE60_10320 [Pseudoxanthomonas mexicana]|uniref:Uncharacterized protein n=1 Tax=Pseudoxanthomonas mexicana TaxID=128785 RepID=A0A7G9T8D4_PSEMX|nr:hypothetical protein [Pseudoxanthomonas mexicana]QNN76359.1 hypothetical protein IAE60_10320 [Pseudoxanthomonas mexicana]
MDGTQSGLKTMHDRPQDAIPVINRGADGKLFVNAPLFGALPRSMQQRILRDMEIDAEFKASPSPPPLPPDAEPIQLLRDPLDLIGDVLRDVASAHASLAEREHAIADLRHQVANLMADAAREIHGRTRRHATAHTPND